MRKFNFLSFLIGVIAVGGVGAFALTSQYLKSDGTPDFQKLKSTANENRLNAQMRDQLMDGLSKMQEQVNSCEKKISVIENSTNNTPPSNQYNCYKKKVKNNRQREMRGSWKAVRTCGTSMQISRHLYPTDFPLGTILYFWKDFSQRKQRDLIIYNNSFSKEENPNFTKDCNSLWPNTMPLEVEKRMDGWSLRFSPTDDTDFNILFKWPDNTIICNEQGLPICVYEGHPETWDVCLKI